MYSQLKPNFSHLIFRMKWVNKFLKDTWGAQVFEVVWSTRTVAKWENEPRKLRNSTTRRGEMEEKRAKPEWLLCVESCRWTTCCSGKRAFCSGRRLTFSSVLLRLFPNSPLCVCYLWVKYELLLVFFHDNKSIPELNCETDVEQSISHESAQKKVMLFIAYNWCRWRKRFEQMFCQYFHAKQFFSLPKF